MIRSILIIGALAASIGAVMAQSDPIATRKDSMKKVARANGDVSKMIKGDAPFRLDTVQTALKVMEETARTMPALYSDDAKTGADTRALPKIWEDKAAFNASFAKFGKDASEASTKIMDEASFKTAYGAVLTNCDSCHDAYRAKK